MAKQATKAAPERLTQEEWLARALEVLAEEGGGKIRVSRLARELGVTTGSLYWHFQDRADLVRSLAEHWARVSTGRALPVVQAAPGDARDRLLALMRFVVEEDMGRYDVAVRAWAAQEPEVAAVVREVDEQRYRFVHALFEEMGFRGEELEVRTRTFQIYLSMELGLLSRETREERLRRVELRHDWFTKD